MGRQGVFVSAARMPYENQRKSIYHSGVSWDAWPQEADQPIAAFADTGFLVPDGGGDLLRQLCTGTSIMSTADTATVTTARSSFVYGSRISMIRRLGG